MPTEAQYRDLFPRARDGHIPQLAAQSDAVFAEFQLDANERRLHFFLAQIGHESGGLTIAEENLNYSTERMCAVWPSRFPTLASAQPFAHNPQALANHVYGTRMGNREPGDGWTYRGRGYIQITGRDGYANVGAISGLDLVNDPALAADPQHAIRTACAFWRWKGLNALCDEGDFEKVTRRINGGLTGLADRRQWLDKVRRVLGAPPPPVGAQPDAARVIAVQRALLARGYRELGAADGLIGPRTSAAIARFRDSQGLPGGLIDDALLAALGILG